MPLRAGNLRSRVTIQSKTETSDGSGGTSKTWADVATVWAKVAPADASGDVLEAERTVSRRRYTVTIRRRAGVTSAMRLVKGAQVFEIASVLEDDGMRDAMVIECREAVIADGGALLLRYAAGDARAGVGCVRNLAAEYFDAAGVRQMATAHELRDGHYIGGVRTQLIESLGRNDIPNDTAVGAAVGALPTGWSNNVVAGVAMTVIGTVTDPSLPGITGVRLKFDNANAAAAFPNFNFGPTALGGTPYVPGQSRAVSCYLALVANIGAVTVNVSAYSWGAGGAFAATMIGSPTVALAPALARYAAVVSTANAAAAFERMRVLLSLAAGGSVTVDVYLPQDELAARSSSVILTTNAAVTRPDDVVTIPGVNTGGAPATLYQRYYDLATAAWVEPVTPYVSSAPLPRAVDRAYALDKVSLGVRTLAEMQAA